MIKFYQSNKNQELDNSKEPIEATYMKYEASDQEHLNVIAELENEKFKNKKLTGELEIVNNSLQMTNRQLEGVKKFNHKLEQDVEYYKIQVSNLKNINIKFIRTINNLQSYREYVAQLLAKKTRCTQKIQRLIKEIKNMQNIIRNKNNIINQKSRAYEIAKLQATHIIKETYGI